MQKALEIITSARLSFNATNEKLCKPKGNIAKMFIDINIKAIINEILFLLKKLLVLYIKKHSRIINHCSMQKVAIKKHFNYTIKKGGRQCLVL